MSFVHVAALAVAMLIIAPVVAHLLRRRRAQDQPFAPAAIVPPSPPAARRRSHLEDRGLFVIRALAIAALALLGATPLLRCAKLSLGRHAGASVALAIVVDDSMSMRAHTQNGTRFDVAKGGAMDLLSGAREGDSIAIVLAGAPARVALGSTLDLHAAVAVIDSLSASDRATDLDGAIALARSALNELPQSDKRVVLLSDRCDGHPDAQPIGEGIDFTLWAPSQGLDFPASDCAILRADRTQLLVRVHVLCTSTEAAAGRSIEVLAANKLIATRLLPPLPSDIPGTAFDVAMDIPEHADEPDFARLVGPSDSIPSDDGAPIANVASALMVAAVSERGTTSVVTGGPPPVEQALDALESGAVVHPLPTVPDTIEELTPFAALIVDDPPGFTPEARRALAAWLLRGGVALLTLGPRAAAAPIGASLEPFLPSASRWVTSAPDGIALSSGTFIGPSAEGLVHLHPKGRSVFELDPHSGVEAIVRWSDGVPLLLSRQVSRGTAFTLALPMHSDLSDLVMRPAFLALLDRVVEIARARGGARRLDIGSGWAFEVAQDVEVRGEFGLVPLDSSEGHKRAIPTVAGRYDIRIDGVTEARYAMVPEREIDFRVRRVAEAATRSELGATVSSLDISRYVALAMLGLFAAELALRFLASRRERNAARV